MTGKLSIDQFAEMVKAKHPEYKDRDNATLASAMLSKFPEYKDRVDIPAVSSAEPAAPSLTEAFNMGVAEHALPDNSGIAANLAHAAGGYALPLAGAAMGAPAGIPGIVLGSAAGRQWQKNIAQVGLPEYANSESTAQQVYGSLKEGALNAAGEGALRAGGSVARAIGKEVIPPITATLTGTSRRAIDALINDGPGVLKYVGIKPEQVAAGAQSVQDLLKSGKSAIEAGYKKILAGHHDELTKAVQEAQKTAQAYESDANTIAKALQERIPQLYKQAAEEYHAAMDAIIGPKSKYYLEPGAAYPYTINMSKQASGTVKSIQREYGFDQSDLPGDMAGAAKTFNWFGAKIARMKDATVDEAYNFQKQLNHAIEAQRDASGRLSPLGSALSKLKSKVMGVLDDAVPEMRPMNQAYAAKIGLADELSRDASADSLATRIRSHQVTKGKTWDAWKQFAAQDEETASLLGDVIDRQAKAADIAARVKETQKVADAIGDLKSTYELGKGGDRLVLMAQKDPVMSDILARSKGKEDIYTRLKSIFGADNPAGEIERIMSEGGNKADALRELAAESPALRDAILDAQRRVYGGKFTPWMRTLPQTGYTPGLIGTVGGGVGASAALGNPIPAVLAVAGLAASSPRLVAKTLPAAYGAARAVGSAFARPAVESASAPVGAAVSGMIPSALARRPAAELLGQGMGAVGGVFGMFQTPDDVKAAHDAGQISPEEAEAVLKAKWPETYY